jgi:hypothetical protein
MAGDESLCLVHNPEFGKTIFTVTLRQISCKSLHRGSIAQNRANI